MKITYYLEVLSSWCHAAEPAWAELRAKYAGQVEFEWRIALMEPGDFPVSRAQCDWFYRRVNAVTHTGKGLTSGWLEPELKGAYLAYNLVAEAGRQFGFVDDRLRLALAEAGHGEGRSVWDLAVAVDVASNRFGIDRVALQKAADSPEVAARVRESTEQFKALGARQRPTFVLENDIGDRAVVSGLWSLKPLESLVQALLGDQAAYRAFAAANGGPPKG